VSTTARPHNFAREYIAEADALLTGSEAAAIRAINSSRVAHRRHDDFSLAAAELRSAAKILGRVGEIAQQVDTAISGERY
jgi:hypothetical protein